MEKPADRGRCTTSAEDRSVSPVIGVVLLFGLVAVASLSLFVVGAGLVADSEGQLEQERIEQSFIELSHTVATESERGDMASQLELEAGDQGAITHENSATMEVNADNLGGPIRFDIGTIEWENEEGTTVAYQGGGVFRDTGDETQLLSSPSIRYDLDTETLTMPIYNVSGDQTLDSGTVRASEDSIASEHEVANMQKDNVTIRVESEYYLGWKDYFERQAGDTIVTDYGKLNGDKGYIVAELGYTQFDDTFENGVTYSGTCDGQGGGPGGGSGDDCDRWEVSEGDPSQPLDSVVKQMIDNPEGTMGSDFDEVYATGISGSEHFEDEYVLVENDLDGADITVDLSDGNATLAIDGDVRGTSIRVTDREPGNTLQLYVNGSYLNEGEAVCVEPCDQLEEGSVIQMFGTSEMAIQFGQGGNPSYEGIIYAASDEETWDHLGGGGQCDPQDQLCIQATPNVYGAVVVKSADIQGGGSVSIEMDPDISEEAIDFREDLLPPQITYMNVVEHRMSVENP